MTHVFVSYKREDAERANRLVQGLERGGLAVWWDRDLRGGESWHASIEKALDEAGCVVVLWSKASVGPEGGFVRDEAGRALIRGRLVPVLIDNVRPPLGFGEHQAIDLTRWRGNSGDPFFVDLLATVRAKLEGHAVPPPIGPRQRALRRMMAGSGASVALGVAMVFGANVLRVQDRFCAASAVSDVCGALGLGNRPPRRERLTWEARPSGSCEAIREHLRAFPAGAYRSEALALLEGARPDTAPGFTPFVRAAAWAVRTAEQPWPDSVAAMRDARLRAIREAGEQIVACGPRSPLERFVAATLRNERFDCRRQPGGGWGCALTCELNCTMTQRVVTERCGR